MTSNHEDFNIHPLRNLPHHERHPLNVGRKNASLTRTSYLVTQSNKNRNWHPFQIWYKTAEVIKYKSMNFISFSTPIVELQVNHLAALLKQSEENGQAQINGWSLKPQTLRFPSGERKWNRDSLKQSVKWAVSLTAAEITGGGNPLTCFKKTK